MQIICADLLVKSSVLHHLLENESHTQLDHIIRESLESITSEMSKRLSSIQKELVIHGITNFPMSSENFKKNMNIYLDVSTRYRGVILTFVIEDENDVCLTIDNGKLERFISLHEAQHLISKRQFKSYRVGTLGL